MSCPCLLPLFDVPVDGSMLATARQELPGIRIETGTSTSRRLIYRASKLEPDVPSSLAKREGGANAAFGFDYNGQPIIALRRDATRDELMHEMEHARDFLEWRALQRTDNPQTLVEDWGRFVRDPLNRARLELQAYMRMESTLGSVWTTQERRAVLSRLQEAESTYFGLGGLRDDLRL